MILKTVQGLSSLSFTFLNAVLSLDLGKYNTSNKSLIIKPSKNLPLPLFAKEGDDPSLWQREVGRDFLNNLSTLF